MSFIIASFRYSTVAWATNQKAVDMDRPKEARFPATSARCLESAQTRCAIVTPFPITRSSYFSGHLGCKTRHAEGLEQIVADFFGIPAQGPDVCRAVVDPLRPTADVVSANRLRRARSERRRSSARECGKLN